jgi:hypothetical protein
VYAAGALLRRKYFVTSRPPTRPDRFDKFFGKPFASHLPGQALVIVVQSNEIDFQRANVLSLPGDIGARGIVGTNDRIHDTGLAIIRRSPNRSAVNKMLAGSRLSVPMEAGMSSDDKVCLVFLE